MISIKHLIKQLPQLATNYLFYGNDACVIDSLLEIIRQHARTQAIEQMGMCYVDSQFDWEALLAHLMTPQLFSAKSMTVLTLKAKLNKKTTHMLQRLGHWLTQQDTHYVVIRLQEHAATHVKPHLKQLVSWVICPVYKQASHGERLSWLQYLAQQQGLHIHEEAYHYLLHRYQDSIALQQAILHLALLYPGQQISADHCHSLDIPGTTQTQALLHALHAGDGTQAAQLAMALLAQGVEPMLIVWLISQSILASWLAIRGQQQHPMPEALASIGKAHQPCRWVDADTIAHLLQLCSNTEMALKSNGGDPKVLIHYLCTALSPNTQFGLQLSSSQALDLAHPDLGSAT